MSLWPSSCLHAFSPLSACILQEKEQSRRRKFYWRSRRCRPRKRSWDSSLSPLEMEDVLDPQRPRSMSSRVRASLTLQIRTRGQAKLRNSADKGRCSRDKNDVFQGVFLDLVKGNHSEVACCATYTGECGGRTSLALWYVHLFALFNIGERKAIGNASQPTIRMQRTKSGMTICQTPCYKPIVSTIATTTYSAKVVGWSMLRGCMSLFVVQDVLFGLLRAPPSVFSTFYCAIVYCDIQIKTPC